MPVYAIGSDGPTYPYTADGRRELRDACHADLTAGGHVMRWRTERGSRYRGTCMHCDRGININSGIYTTFKLRRTLGGKVTGFGPCRGKRGRR